MKNKNLMSKIECMVLVLLIFGISNLFAEPCGDVNSNGIIDIIDALLIAQFSVDLNPQPFDQSAADVSGDGTANIVDALLIAQYYVGIITELAGCPTGTPVPPLPTIPPTDWAVKMADSFMGSSSRLSTNWSYEAGTVLEGIEQLYNETGNEKYYNYIKSTMDSLVNSSGSISGYSMGRYWLDDIATGRLLFIIYDKTKDSRYKKAMDTLREHLDKQPRTNSGGFWHKEAYPYQMWLDGLYMAAPFYTLYGQHFNEPEDFDDVTINQLILIESHTRDPITGLLYHGWDESKQEGWADPVTGCSPCFWGRAIGWYAMALVDVLDFLPGDHPQRDNVIAIVRRLMAAVVKYQDPATGVWYQVVDQGGREGNYLEASFSCMIVYAMTKSVRKGYIDHSYLYNARTGYDGIIDQFINVNSDGKVNITRTCTGAGLGSLPPSIPYRDGTYEYYVSIGTRTNDKKAVGPFISASVEIQNTN